MGRVYFSFPAANAFKKYSSLFRYPFLCSLFSGLGVVGSVPLMYSEKEGRKGGRKEIVGDKRRKGIVGGRVGEGGGILGNGIISL